jgi:hypothetical protein
VRTGIVKIRLEVEGVVIRTFEFDNMSVTIGRAPENMIQLTDTKSSRKHCVVELEPDGGFKLVDLDSSNGTSLNGVKVKQQSLKPGDRIGIGGVGLVVEFDPMPEVFPVAVKAPEWAPVAAPPPVPVAAPVPAPVAFSAPAPDQPAAPVKKERAPVRVIGDEYKEAARERRVIRILATVGIVIMVVAVAGWFLRDVYRSYKADKVVEDAYQQARGLEQAGKKAEAYAAYKKHVEDYPLSVYASELTQKIQKYEDSYVADRQAKEKLDSLKIARQVGVGSAALRRDLQDYVMRYQTRFPAYAEDAKFQLELIDKDFAQKAEASFGEAQTLAASLLAGSDFGAALNVWREFGDNFSGTDLAGKADAEIVAVWSAAGKEFDSLRQKANALIVRKRYDEARDVYAASLDKFRGTRCHFEAKMKIQAIEQLACGLEIPKTSVVDPGARNDCMDLALRADDLVRKRRYGDALKQYGDIMGRLPASDKDMRIEFERRIEDIRSLDSLLNAMIASANSGTLKSADYDLGSRKGTIKGASETQLRVVFDAGEIGVTFETRTSRQMYDLYRRVPLAAPETYALAVYCYDNGLKAEGNTVLNEYVCMGGPKRPEHEGRAYALVSRQRGISVPADGFTYFSGEWVTSAELKNAKDVTAVRKLTGELESAGDDAAWARIFAKYEEIRDAANPNARDGLKAAMAECFRAKRGSIVSALDAYPGFRSLEMLKELKKELNVKRAEALKVIFDKKIYPDEDHGRIGQPAVDKVVNAVKDLWEKAGERIAVIDKTVQEYINAIKTADDYLAKLDCPPAADQALDLVLSQCYKRVDLRSVCLDDSEKNLLEHNKKIYEFNEKLQCHMSDPEKRQAQINNEYREMMGRKVLELQDALGTAARKHTEAMAAAGSIWHDGPDGSPMSRCKDAGYGGPVGENCAMGMGDPLGAFTGWYNSSGHHRNMLNEGWNQIGVGNVGVFWTQNFGNGAAQAK